MKISKGWVALSLALVGSVFGVWSAFRHEISPPQEATETMAATSVSPSPKVAPPGETGAPESASTEIDEIVTSDNGLSCVSKGTTLFQSEWKALKEIALVVKVETPKREDIRWRFTGNEGAICQFSIDLPAAVSLLDELKRLPDFSHRAIIDAMDAKADGVFVAWPKPAEQS